MRVRLLILVVLVVLCVAPIWPQTRRRPGPVSSPALGPFDRSLNSLPAGYTGLNIESLLKLVVAHLGQFKTNEYDTTEERERKLQKVIQSPITGSLTMESVLAFSAKPETSYDADSQELGAFSEFDPNDSSEYRAKALSIQGTHKQSSSIAQNAFGVKFRIVNDLYDDTSLLIRESEGYWGLTRYDDGKTAKYGEKGINFTVRLNRDKAKVIRENLRTLLICRLVAPYIDTGSSDDPATMTDPHGVYRRARYLQVRLIDAWLYDKSTGEILVKARTGDEPPRRPTLSGTASDPGPAKATKPEASTPPQTETPPTVPVQILNKPMPEYTPEARKNHITGVVMVEATFKADGHIADIVVVKGLGYGLDEKAIEAFLKTQFRPAESNGRPVDFRTKIAVTFSGL